MRSFAAKALRILLAVSRVIVEINTRVLLTLVFFLIVTPAGLLFRLFGRSPLAPNRAGSLWVRRSEDSGPERPF